MKLLIDNVDDDKIRTLVDEHISELDQKEPYEVVDELNNALLCAHSIPTFETKRQWRQIRMDDLKTFCRDLCTQMKIIALMQGNVTEEIARSIMQTTLANLDCGKIDNVSFLFILIFFDDDLFCFFSVAEFNEFTCSESACGCTLSSHQINGS